MPRLRSFRLLLLLCLAAPAGQVLAQPVPVGAGSHPEARLGEHLAATGDAVFFSAVGEQGGGAVFLVRGGIEGEAPLTRLTSPSPEDDAVFGRVLTAADGVLLVTARRRRLTDAGQVHLFEQRGGTAWKAARLLRNPLPSIADAFGDGLVVDGDTVVVGAPGAHGRGPSTGAAYVYARHAGAANAWGLAGRLAAPDGVFRERFGYFIALDERFAAVGAVGSHYEDGGSGAVYLYDRTSAGAAADTMSSPWSLAARLAAPDAVPRDRFGERVAFHDGLLFVGATGAQGESPEAGAVYVFAEVDGAWRCTGKLTAPDGAPGDRFGGALAAAGHRLFVGAPRHDAAGRDAGAVYVFERDRAAGPEAAGTWRLAAKLMWPSGASRDGFGSALAVRGDDLFVSAPGASFASGAVYRFDLGRSVDGLRTFERFAGPDEGLPEDPVNALLQDEDGLIWIGTQNGLAVYDGYAARLYRHDPADTTSLVHDAVLKLFMDGGGRYWVGTEDGLCRYDRRADRFVRYAFPKTGRFSRQSFVAIFEDRDGVVWTGTNGRLYRYDPAADRFAEYAPFAGPPERLGEPYVSGIQQDRAGRLWVLAKNLWENRASLYRIDVARGEVDRFPLAEAWGQVGPLLVDRAGRLWLRPPDPVPLPAGSSEGPLHVLHPPGPVAPAAPWAAFEDEAGGVWFGTAAGVYHRAHGADTTVRHDLRPPSHLRNDANFVRALHQARTGRLLLGTWAGVFRTGPAPPPGAAVPVVLTNVEVSGADGRRTLHPYGLDRLDLTHRDDQVNLTFAALAFTHAAGVRYRYRLDGYDRQWTEAGTRRFASYAHLPPGDYVFRVESTRGDSLYASPGLALPVVVHPAFWQTAWFRMLLLALLAGLVVMVHRYRVARLLELERLRLRIAGDLHDDLSSDLSGVALVTDVVRQRPYLREEDRRRLGEARETTQRMLDRLRDLVWSINPEHDRLEDLSLYMKTTAANLLEGVDYTFEAPAAPLTGELDMALRRHLFLVYKEALHNVARHARARHVAVRLAREDGRLVLEVRDDGEGFDAGAVEHGEGLRSMRARARALGGRLGVESRPGTGTTVRLVVRLDSRRRDGRMARTRDGAAVRTGGTLS